MDELSEEQTIIYENVRDHKNTIVDACAGTGKTTLILATAKMLYRRKFLQMTYNSMLRHEVNERVKKNNIKNMSVHTFHSLAVKYYYSTAYTDTGMRYIIQNNLRPVIPIEPFQVLVLDEAQDMSFLYYQFMCKVILDMGSPVQLLILGDYMQGLYEFKGSDTRFLTHAEAIWENHPGLKTKKFVYCTMKMSYRITNQMCSFVNKALLGEPRMEACRDGMKVLYASNTRSNLEKIVFGEITKLFENGVNPSDIFILGGSVKGANSNIRHLENTLVERGIPCHVPILEDDKIDERVINGKVVFSTFHAVKGRQRRYVFIVGFDNSYLRFYARTLPRDICPNTIYVACTRAIEGLYLLESNQFTTDRPLECLRMNHIELYNADFMNFRGIPRNQFFEYAENLEKDQFLDRHMNTPTDLIKFLPESVIEEVSPILDRIFTVISTNHMELDIPSIIETKTGFFEEVSDLNGIAIPCIYYDSIYGTRDNIQSLLRLIQENIDDMNVTEHSFLKNAVDSIPENIETIADYLYITNVYKAVQEKLYFKIKQIAIDEYTWLHDDIIKICNERMERVIGVECKLGGARIEETIIQQKNNEQHKRIDEVLAPFFEQNIKFRFTARTDLITERTVWELKCTSQITIDHKLQTLIYAWLWRTLYPEDRRDVKLFNIKTGEIIRLDVSIEELNHIMVLLLKGKFQEQKRKTDEEFIFNCFDYTSRLIPTPEPLAGSG